MARHQKWRVAGELELTRCQGGQVVRGSEMTSRCDGWVAGGSELTGCHGGHNSWRLRVGITSWWTSCQSQRWQDVWMSEVTKCRRWQDVRISEVTKRRRWRDVQMLGLSKPRSWLDVGVTQTSDLSKPWRSQRVGVDKTSELSKPRRSLKVRDDKMLELTRCQSMGIEWQVMTDSMKLDRDLEA
jgi:hypothetical protein